MDLFEQLWTVWKKYVDYSVVENHELKEILFHVFLGVILTTKGYTYIESGKKKSVRLHLFMLQDSGTGKSQLMKAHHDLLLSLGIKSRFTVTDNQAAITGTVYLLPDEIIGKLLQEAKEKGTNVSERDRVVIKPGLLKDLHSLIWDEGSILLQNSPFMKNMTDIFQVVMDEPGRVSKGMKLGTIDYDTNTTIVAGSYMFNEFKDTLMKKGFLQRMFLFFKKFNEKEERNLRIGVNLLKRKKNPLKLKELEKIMRMQLDKIPLLKNKIITFNDKDILKFNIDLEEIYSKYINKAFTGEKQVVLKTFYSRLHLIIDKVATQRAIILGKTEVDYEDLQYAKQLSLKHIVTLLHIFDYLVGEEGPTIPERREMIILSILRLHDNKMVQKELLDELLKLKKLGKWDLGFNRTISFIDKLIEKHKLKQDTGIKGSKVIYI